MQNRTYSWMNPCVEMRETAKTGKGIYATRFISKGDLISVFGGYVITRDEELMLPEEFNDEGVQISDDLILGIKDASGLEDASYINHSCDPNSGYNGQIFLVAMRDIEDGEEITFDYAMCLYRLNGDKQYSFDCYCGSRKCRKKITDDDWKITELQQKYNGYFQWYLQEKIDHQKKTINN